jgi:hypothetical protein
MTEIDLNLAGTRSAALNYDDHVQALARAVADIDGIRLPGDAFGQIGASSAVAQAWLACQASLSQSLGKLQTDVGADGDGLFSSADGFEAMDQDSVAPYQDAAGSLQDIPASIPALG